MASGKSGCGTWFKFGCFGCLGIIILGALAFGAVFMVAKSSVSDSDFQETELSPEIPRAAVEAITEHAQGKSSAKEGAGGLRENDSAEAEPIDLSSLSGRSGRLILNIESAELKLIPLPAGEPLRVEAQYDTEGWDLVESLSLEESEDWEYQVNFTPKGNLIFQMIRQMVGGQSAKVQVYVPTDQRMALELELTTGGGEIDLTGVDLSEVRLAMNKGGLNVRIDEPSPIPVESFVIDASMGGFDIKGLANASPQNLDIRMSMGGGAIDLRGDWRTSSEVEVKLSNGGGIIQLPSGVDLFGLSEWGFDDAAHDPASGTPLLRFQVDGDPKDIEFR